MALPRLNDVLISSAHHLAVETAVGVGHFAVVDAEPQSDGTTQISVVGSQWLALGTYPATYVVDETRTAGRFALHGCIRSGESIQFVGVFMRALG